MKQNNPSISVVMPTYDETERLCAALTSLSQQDYPADRVEIIVVDDASPTQADGEKLQRALAPFTLKLLRHKTNQGRAKARNTGLRCATGDIVVFLDSDMTVEPGFFRVHAAGHKREEDTVFIGNIVWGHDISPSALTRYLERRGVHKINGQGSVHFKCFVTGNSSLRRDLLERVGLFDEDFTVYGGEDLELGYRLHIAGAQFSYLENAVSHHNHIRPIDQLCRLMYTYGQGSMPVLIGKHPDLAPVLRLDFLQQPIFSPKRILLKTALLSGVYWSFYWAAVLLMHWRVPDLLFDYLLWSNRTRGYVQRNRHIST